MYELVTFFKLMQDASGVIDGKHVPVIIPHDKQTAFKNSHG